MTHYTPGPIVNGRDAIGEAHGLWRPDAKITDADIEREANARLMAKAPELLEALQSAVARIELANDEGDPILSAWLPNAQKIIDEATQLSQAERFAVQFDEWKKLRMICLPGDNGTSGTYAAVTQFKDGSAVSAHHPRDEYEWTLHAIRLAPVTHDDLDVMYCNAADYANAIHAKTAGATP